MSFFGLVVVGSEGVQMNYLAEQDWSKLPSTVPVLFIAMVFHNVIPVVTTQLEGEKTRTRTTTQPPFQGRPNHVKGVRSV